MAEEDLTLRMRARGARDTARDVERVDNAVQGVDRSSKRMGTSTRNVSRDISVFTRALQFMQTRAVVSAVLIGAIGVAAAAATPALALLTAAVVTAGLALAPAFLLGAGAVQMFTAQMDEAGTVAYKLSGLVDRFKTAFSRIVQPGAEKLLSAAVYSLRELLPTFQSLKGPLTTFSGGMAQAVRLTADALGQLGPEMRSFIRQAGSLLPLVAQAFGPLAGLFLDVGIAGIPVLRQLLTWFVSFVRWARLAVRDVEEFFRSAQAAAIVESVFAAVAVAANYLADVIHELAGIASQLFTTAIQPLLPAVGVGLVGAFRGLLGVLTFVNDNFDTLSDVLAPLVAGFVAYKVATIALTVAIKALTIGYVALNLVMQANLFVRIITLTAALATGFVILYRRSETFRNIVNAVWNVLKGYGGFLVKLYSTIFRGVVTGLQAVARWFGTLGDRIKTTWGALQEIPSIAWGGIKSAVTDMLNWVIGKLNWMIDQVNALPGVSVGRIQPIGGPAPLPPGVSSPGIPDAGSLSAYPVRGRRAAGGPIHASGVYEVGEEGRERVWMPRGALVEPNGGFGGDVVVHSYIHLDGREVARTLVRHARKKKAVR